MLFTTLKSFEKIDGRYVLTTSIWKTIFSITITEETHEDYAVYIYVNGVKELEMSGFGTIDKARSFVYAFLMWFEYQRNLIVENI